MSSRVLLETKGYNQLVAGKDGYFLYNANDQYVGRAMEEYGEYSGIELDLLKSFCGAGDVVLEVGANIGAHTVGLARSVGPTGRVLAFEPQRLVFQTLCANVALNSLENVECIWAAVGIESGAVLVPYKNPRENFNFGGLSLRGAHTGEHVSCVTLDRYVALRDVRLLKIDVEGMEAEVIRGGEQLIQKVKPILYVENDRVENSEELMKLIARLDYRMCWHLPPMYNPNNFFSNTQNRYGDMVSANLICIHRDSQIQIGGFQEIVDFSWHPSV